MGVVIATIIVIVVIAAIIAQEPAVVSLARWQEDGDTSTSRSEVVRNLGLLAAALVGLGFGIWQAITAYLQAQASQKQADAAIEQAAAANDQARIAQKGHVTERFSRAIEHLGSKNLSIRLGGTYSLWRLIEESSKDSPEDAIRVMDPTAQ